MADVGKKTGKQTQAGRDVYETPEGEMVSEKSTTFEYKGKWVNIPTIHDGKEYSDAELIEMLDEGLIEPTSIHNKLEEALEAAESRSDSLEFDKGDTLMLEEQMELFNEGGLKDEGGSVDPESGNDVPIGSTKEEVRDDIPAMLSEGEFVFPADVVRYVGLENLMRIRQDAKMGLKKMEAMGQMGNSEEATIPDDMPFDMSDLIIVAGDKEDDLKEMAQGGVIKAQQGTYATGQTGIAGTTPSVFDENKAQTDVAVPASSIAPTPIAPPSGGYRPLFLDQTPPPPVTTPDTPPIVTPEDNAPFIETVDQIYETIEYINPETGERIMISFYNGKPIDVIPEGFIPYAEYLRRQQEEQDTTTTDNLEDTSTESALVREVSTDDDSIDKAALSEMVTSKQQEDANKFKKTLAKAIDNKDKQSLMELYAQTQRDKKIMTGLALTGIGTIPSLVGRFLLSQREKNLEEALTQEFGKDWENSAEFKALSEQSIFEQAKSALSTAFDSAFTKEGRDAYYENYKGKYDTASHPLGGGTKSVLTAREQQAFDNAVESGNVNVANHYAIINNRKQKMMDYAAGKPVSGLSDFDKKQADKLYKKTPTIADKKRRKKVDSGIKSSVDDQTKSAFPTGRLPIDTPPPVSDPAGFPDAEQIDLSGMGAGAAQPSVQTDIVAGLGSQGYRSEEDIIEQQREAAKEAARKAASDRRKKKRRRDAEKGKGAFAKRKQKTGVGGRNIGGR